jgi:hypothetical protein
MLCDGYPSHRHEIMKALFRLIATLRRGSNWIYAIESEGYPGGYELIDAPLKIDFIRDDAGRLVIQDFDLHPVIDGIDL